MLETGLRIGVAPQRGGVVATLGHRRLECTELVLQRHQVGCARQRVLAQRQPLLQRRTLVVQRDASPFREGDLARGDAGLPGEHAEQRGLAGAVGTRERDDISAIDAEGDAVEQEGARELLPEVGCDHDRHELQRRRAV